jgi:tRNA-dihydrouridine synthase 2
MGSALMRDISNAKSIMSSLVQHFGDRISVSCKIRVLNKFEDTLMYVKEMASCGIHFISIHSRTVAEESKVPSRWNIVKNIIESGEV